MAITTAFLPSASANRIKTANAKSMHSNNQESDATSQQPLTAMWSSLMACSASPQEDTGSQGKFVRLPSQSSTSIKTNTNTTTTHAHSLVLLWVTSPSSSYIHCFDLTLRCCGIVEHDSDGWRGYYEGIEGIVDMTATTRSMSGVGDDPNSHQEQQQQPLYVTCLTSTELIIFVDPHLHLSCRLAMKTTTTTTTPTTTTTQQQPQTIKMSIPVSQYGKATTMDMEPPGQIAVGTDTGHVLLMELNESSSSTCCSIQLTLVISPHQLPSMVTCIQLHPDHQAVFVSYQKGICCFEIGTEKAGVTARHDLDGRSNKIKGDSLDKKTRYMVARPDGIYVYGKKQKHQVSPIDGSKNAICAIETNKGSSYALVASTDSKSGRYVFVLCVVFVFVPCGCCCNYCVVCVMLYRIVNLTHTFAGI
jgi:hypothetical protein